MFAVVYLGCCTVAAHGPRSNGEANYLHIYLIPLRVVLPTLHLLGVKRPFDTVLLDKVSPC